MLKRILPLSALLFACCITIPNSYANTTQHNTYQTLPSKSQVITTTDFGYQTYIFHFSDHGQHLSRIDFIDHLITQPKNCQSWRYVSALSNTNVYKEAVLRVSNNYDSVNKDCIAHAYFSNNAEEMGNVLHLFQTKKYVDIAGFNLSAAGFTDAVDKLYS